MLTLINLNQNETDRVIQTIPGGVTNVQDIYPLSPLQEGMLFHRLLNQSDTYVLSTLLELESRAHVDVLIGALQKVMARHDILRTAVLWEHLPRPLQVVYGRAILPIEELMLDPDRGVIEQLREQMKPGRQCLDIRRAPIALLQIAADPHSTRWYAVLHVHHLLCDHQSLKIVVSEAMTYLDGREHELPEPVPFRSYVTQGMASGRTAEAKAFFRRGLGDVEEPTAPFGLLDVHGDGAEIEEHAAALDPTFAAHIRIVARRCGVSAARLFHAAWALVVARTSVRDDVVFGTVVLTAQQRTANAQRMLGLSVNTLPLRLRLKGVSAADLVRQTHVELSELLKYEATALTLAQSCSGIPSTLPLFTSLLNFRRGAPEHGSVVGVRVLARGEAWTNYPITLTVDDVGDGFVLMAKTDRRIGAQRILSYLGTALGSLAHALESAPESPAVELEVLPDAERQQVIEKFNATAAPYPQDKVIHELFEEQVARNPDAVAVVYAGHSLTFDELNGRANQLARYLLRKGLGPDRLVALCVDRSLEVMVGLLGVLKSGAAYIPLDPSNPPERLEHILTDAQPAVLLTVEKLKSGVPRAAAEVIALDADWQDIARERRDNLDRRSVGASPSDLAYVIYTSGSTGTPKGVMVEHRNIVNYATHIIRQFDVAEGDGSLVCTSISFDLMLTSLYPVLLSGRTVRLCREEQGLPDLADDVIRHQNLAPLKLTPSHLALLEQPLRRGELAGRVRVLALGGEPLPVSAVRLWQRHVPATRIFNHYGPTETTVGCLIYDTAELNEHASGSVPIGRPISNAKAYVLDAHRQPVPAGVTGEIYIAGAGVSRGYLHRPELTAERFLPDSFSADPDARMYRTGDLGRWRADGTMEFLGRTDDQVKIRGYRIELGEIQARLRGHEQVKDAVVLALQKAPGETRLVAYVVPAAPAVRSRPSVEGLRAHLKKILPEYMIPGVFIILDCLPLTPNGKLDRRALPAPDATHFASKQYVPPEGEIEQAIADIWRQLLRIERVGRYDDFFELGGHSLLAIRVVAHIADALRVDVPLRAVFERPTIQGLGDRVIQEITAEMCMEAK